MYKSTIRSIKIHPLIFAFSVGIPFGFLLIFGIIEILESAHIMPIWAYFLTMIVLMSFPIVLGLVFNFAFCYLYQQLSMRLSMWRSRIYFAIFLLCWELGYYLMNYVWWAINFYYDQPSIFSSEKFMGRLFQDMLGIPFTGGLAIFFAIYFAVPILLLVELVGFLPLKLFKLYKKRNVAS